ncbi:MAG: nuclear transport factor 2 family protein [Sphingobacteriales bacterium]|nr:MAG: nuclear transport factor 2 family protein [Sphingobacteriales bacterium]
MNGNEALISKFYISFQQLDYAAMQQCYADTIIFNDPAFGILQGAKAKAMWEMLCKNAKEFSLTFSNIQLLDEEYATCNWVATYTFSKTGRKVVNHIKAHLRIQDGKITEHTDQFDIWKWSRQALGMPGLLLGWSGYMKNKIHQNARQNLEKFMAKQ